MSILTRFSSVATLAFAMAATLFVSPVQAANPGVIPGKAVVMNVTGSANVKIGDVLEQGKTIVTGPASSVMLDLGANGQDLEIKADSSVTLETLTISPTGADTNVKTLISIDKGGLNGNVKKLSKESDYKVRTTKGVAGIRGTVFSVNADGTATCWKGQVTFIFVVNGVALAPITIKTGETVVPPSATNPNPTVVKASGAPPIFFVRTGDDIIKPPLPPGPIPPSPLTGVDTGETVVVIVHNPV